MTKPDFSGQIPRECGPLTHTPRPDYYAHKGPGWGWSKLPEIRGCHEKGLNSNFQTALELRKLRKKDAKHVTSELEAVPGIGISSFLWHNHEYTC